MAYTCPKCGWSDEPVVPQEYPKWVDGRIVNSAEEAASPVTPVPETLPETAPELPKAAPAKAASTKAPAGKASKKK